MKRNNLAEPFDGACGILYGTVSSLHSSHEERARESGLPVLDIETFWNKFRRRFPGTYAGWEIYPRGEYSHSCRAVHVKLGPEDKSLASLIDEFGWLEGGGRDAVLNAFSETQEPVLGMIRKMKLGRLWRRYFGSNWVGGPVTIAKLGRRVVSVMSADDYERLQASVAKAWSRCD